MNQYCWCRKKCEIVTIGEYDGYHYQGVQCPDKKCSFRDPKGIYNEPKDSAVLWRFLLHERRDMRDKIEALEQRVEQLEKKHINDTITIRADANYRNDQSQPIDIGV